MEKITIVSEFDNLPLAAAFITPNETARGTVVFSHGMAEHKERYYPFMEYLAHNRYNCVIHDHRGHGGSILGDTRDLGYFYTRDSNAIVEDLYTVVKKSKNDVSQ